MVKLKIDLMYMIPRARDFREFGYLSNLSVSHAANNKISMSPMGGNIASFG